MHAKVASIYLDGEYLRKHPTWHEEDAAWKAEQVASICNTNRLDPKTLCEVGCGAGGILRTLSHFFPKARRLVGWEVSADAYALCLAKSHDERISYHLGDALMQCTDCFDLVLALDVFEHVQDYIGFLVEMRRLGDRFVFHIPLDLYAFGLLHTGALRSAREGNGHLHHFTAETALDTLVYAGYKVVDMRFTPSFERAPRRGFRNRTAYALRRNGFRVSAKHTARWLGGVSLLVLAE